MGEYVKCFCRWSVQEVSDTLSKLTPLDSTVSVILAIGAFAPASNYLSCVERFRTLMPTADVSYIAHSKLGWELEGRAQRHAVAGVLEKLVSGRKRLAL